MKKHTYNTIISKKDFFIFFWFILDEYDHLDYSRPSTSQKPHYDTMINFNIEEKPTNLKTMDVLLKSNQRNINAAFNIDNKKMIVDQQKQELQQQNTVSSESEDNEICNQSLCDNQE